MAHRTRSHRSRLLAVAAIILAGSVTTGVVAYARTDSHRSHVTGDSTPRTTAKDAERAAAEQERALQQAQAISAYQHAIRRAAETKLANDLVAAARQLGWSINLTSDVVSQTSRGDTTDKMYVEIRVRDTDVGELLVSVNTGDPDAVAAGTQDRSGLLRTEVTTSVYLGTDGPNNTAVELFDGTTIIYVRSESATSNAPPRDRSHRDRPHHPRPTRADTWRCREVFAEPNVAPARPSTSTGVAVPFVNRL